MYKFTSITQPAGKFYMFKMRSSQLIPISQSEVRTPYNSTGIQRLFSQNRVNDIATFCEEKSAMFPTPIIVSAKSNVVRFYDEKRKPLQDKYTNLEEGFIEIDRKKISENMLFFSIVDGQHRLAGIEKYFETHKNSEVEDFELAVLIVFDTENYEDAQIFSAINRHQKPVSKSLVYDLYGLSNDNTVEKFAHELVKEINERQDSLMKNKVKMLGFKTDAQIVSQATLVEQIIPLISDKIQEDNRLLIDGYIPEENNKLFLRKYLLTYDVDSASDIVINFLNNWIQVLKNNNLYQNVFEKTVGFMLAFKIFNFLCNRQLHPDIDFNKVNQDLTDLNFKKINLTEIGSSQSGVNKAYKILINEE